MSDVFRTIDPPPPQRPASVYPSAFGAWGGHIRRVESGWWGVNSSEDARHSSVPSNRVISSPFSHKTFFFSKF
jgi:hypothetical protein